VRGLQLGDGSIGALGGGYGADIVGCSRMIEADEGGRWRHADARTEVMTADRRAQGRMSS